MWVQGAEIRIEIGIKHQQERRGGGLAFFKCERFFFFFFLIIWSSAADAITPSNLQLTISCLTTSLDHLR